DDPRAPRQDATGGNPGQHEPWARRRRGGTDRSTPIAHDLGGRTGRVRARAVGDGQSPSDTGQRGPDAACRGLLDRSLGGSPGRHVQYRGRVDSRRLVGASGQSRSSRATAAAAGHLVGRNGSQQPMTAARELPSGIVSPADASIVPAPEVPAAEVHAPEVHASAARAAVGDTVAHAVVDELLRAGVTTVFGIPGLHTLDLYEALADRPAIRHVLVRHEQAAAFAADGYARVTGRAGVCLATTGPGAFNTLTAIAEAWGDSSPVVLLAGQIDAALIGAGAGILHETPDQAGSFRPVTKFAATPRDGPSVLEAVATALHVAVAGRPRPAYVE